MIEFSSTVLLASSPYLKRIRGIAKKMRSVNFLRSQKHDGVGVKSTVLAAESQ